MSPTKTRKVPEPREISTAQEKIIAPTWRARIADPKPPFCSGCLRGADADTMFVDLWMPIERGFLREHGSMAVIAELNRLCLCESCVREMSECLAFDPELHRSQQAKIARVADERDHFARENVLLRSLLAESLTKVDDEGDLGWNDEIRDPD